MLLDDTPRNRPPAARAPVPPGSGSPAQPQVPPQPQGPIQDVASLRLVCLVRAGDGYVVRAAGRLTSDGGPRAQVDIAFGAALGRNGSAEVERAVRLILRWCDDGTTVALVESGSRLALRAEDGTAVTLPRSA